MRTAQLTLICFALVTTLGSGCGTMKGGQPEASVQMPSNDGPVSSTFKANQTKFQACGRDSVSVQTGSTQKLLLAFSVNAEGNVEKPAIEDMSEPDPDLYTCVLRTISRLKFPPPKDGRTKRVRYPLTLKAQ